jgi:hypothetical protein
VVKNNIRTERYVIIQFVPVLMFEVKGCLIISTDKGVVNVDVC